MRHLTFMILGALLVLSAAAPGWGEAPEMGCTIPAAPQKEPVMFDELNAVTNATIPPIDRAVPAIFETAAFGLG
ncbi:MAG: hypothetical protein M0036_20635 [Desulfobacteraceae bacterium]|nr:hypothetical protein [Desulfobacteraceae bacterium]